jgi:hypothetical protein
VIRSNRLLAFYLLIFISSAFAQPQIYNSEIDNFELLLPEKLYPTNLLYEQDSIYGRVSVKNISYHGSLGKFVLQLVDYPSSDQRSAAQRLEAGVDQMSRNPNLQIEVIEDLSTDLLHGILIKSRDRELAQQHAIFIDGRREYHISSDSQRLEDLDQVLEQSEALVRSFKLATANALYYQVYETQKIDALVTAQLNPDYTKRVIESLTQSAAAQLEACNLIRLKTPAELVLLIDDQGMIENALSSPRSKFGRCLELAYIGVKIETPPITKMHLFLSEHLN